MRACWRQDLECGKGSPVICKPVLFSQCIKACSSYQSIIMIMSIFLLVVLQQNLIDSFIQSYPFLAQNSIFHKLFDNIFLKALCENIQERYVHRHLKDWVMTDWWPYHIFSCSSYFIFLKFAAPRIEPTPSALSYILF